MATVMATQQFDQANYSLTRALATFSSGVFTDNGNFLLYGSIPFSDTYRLDWSQSGTSYSTYLGGNGMVQSMRSGLTGGTVTGFFDVAWSGGSYTVVNSFLSISMQTTKLVAAMATATLRDDVQLLNAQFAGADMFQLSSVADTAYGLGGHDIMYGYEGNDRIDGGKDNDEITGGTGADTLLGGAGADVFYYNFAEESGTDQNTRDQIIDFERGKDRIDLQWMDAFTFSSDFNDTFVWRGTGAYETTDAGGHGEIRYELQDRAGTALDQTLILIDTDADSDAEMSIVLKGLIRLAASDFIL